MPSSNGRLTAFLTDFDRLLPGLEAAELPRIGFANGLEDLGVAARRLKPVRSVAHLLEGRLLGDQAPGVAKRRFTRLSLLGEFVDDAPFLGLARAEGDTRKNDVKSLLGADEARQALGAPGARDKAEFDLRQAASGGRDGDAVMRRERDLETAAERCAMQSGDDRLRGVLHCVERLGKVWPSGRLAEFGNVGSGDKGPPIADKDDRLDRAICFGRFDASLQTLADGLRKSVHRRGVDGEQRDFAIDRKVGDRIHGGHGVFPLEWAIRTSMTEREGEVLGFATPRVMIEQPASSGQLLTRGGLGSWPEAKEFRRSL